MLRDPRPVARATTKNSGATHAPPATASTTPAALPLSPSPVLLGSTTATSGAAPPGDEFALGGDGRHDGAAAPEHRGEHVALLPVLGRERRECDGEALEPTAGRRVPSLGGVGGQEGHLGPRPPLHGCLSRSLLPRQQRATSAGRVQVGHVEDGTPDAAAARNLSERPPRSPNTTCVVAASRAGRG